MLKDLKKISGFASIVEVIVTAIIFIVATAGILSTMSMLTPQKREASRKIEAVYVGKGVMDELRWDVDASTWDAGDLSLGDHTQTIGDFNVSYTVTEPTPGLRKVAMDIVWAD